MPMLAINILQHIVFELFPPLKVFGWEMGIEQVRRKVDIFVIWRGGGDFARLSPVGFYGVTAGLVVRTGPSDEATKGE